MGTGFLYVSTPFLLVVAAAAAAVGMESFFCFYEAENWAASSLWVGGVGETKYFVAVKTPMGLEPIEVNFFFAEKFTKIDLGLEKVIKNRSQIF